MEPKRRGRYERLDAKLQRAVRLLGESSALLRDLELNPERNIRRIADALWVIFDVQTELYNQRPDLKPEDLRDQ